MVTEKAIDSVGANFAQLTFSSVLTTTANGSAHLTGTGSYTKNNSLYNLNYNTMTEGALAVGPSMPALLPQPAAQSGGVMLEAVVGSGNQAVTAGRKAGLGQVSMGPMHDPLNPKGAGNAGALAARGGELGVAVARAMPGLVLPDARTSALQGGSPLSLGFVNKSLPTLRPLYLVGEMTENWPGEWLAKMQPYGWGVVCESFKKLENRVRLARFDPLNMVARDAWNAAMPPGVEETAGNTNAWWGQMIDWGAGFLNGITSGGLRSPESNDPAVARYQRMTRFGPFSMMWETMWDVAGGNDGPSLVDTTSAAYRRGERAGEATAQALYQILDIVSTFIAPGGGVAKLLFVGFRLMQTASGGINAAEAFARGDVESGVLFAAGAGLSGMRAALGANTAAGMLVGSTMKSLMAVNAGRMIYSGVDKIQKGDIMGGVLDLMQAGSELFLIAGGRPIGVGEPKKGAKAPQQQQQRRAGQVIGDVGSIQRGPVGGMGRSRYGIGLTTWQRGTAGDNVRNGTSVQMFAPRKGPGPYTGKDKKNYDEGYERVFGKKPQTLGRPASSRVLGENLEAVGTVRPANSAAHHIVAGRDARAAQARAILRREGIDINEAANGVFLPRNSSVARSPATTHSRVHTDRYYDAVNRRLRNAAPGTVRQELDRIGQELLDGTFPF